MTKVPGVRLCVAGYKNVIDSKSENQSGRYE